MKYSIIIPTWNHFDDCLKPCIESIIKFTDLTDCEVLVVANGCSPEDKTKEFVESLGDPFKLIWIDEQVGYTKAMNAGMKAAKGEFLIPFNNDNQLLDQEFNKWIKMLEAPFVDPDVMICGPWLNWCPWAERNFLIFFVVMIRKIVLDIVGYLDESFAPAYGEDTDFCCRIEDDGYKIGVCDITVYKDGMGLGEFPIFHAGNMSYKDWPGGNELLAKNRRILKGRYGKKSMNIENAKKLDGFMSDEELRWLAQRAKQSKIFVQIGAWHGKSSRAIADNLSADGKFYDIDKWTGSQAEQDTNHWSARLMEGDHAFDEYARGMWDHLADGHVTALKMNGKNGAKLLFDMGIQADTIFIDGGHAKGETKADIEYFYPLLKSGGVICGHDYMHEDGMWSDVGPEVKEIFGQNVGQPDGTHIWYTDSKPVTWNSKPNIYDCFIFFNELDLLEIRFNTLYDVVDRFVVVEATSTHQRERKPLYFNDNLKRFEKFLHKVSHVVVDFPSNLKPFDGTSDPAGEAYWALERYQRDKIMDALSHCKDNDIIITSDADEIPNVEVIKNYNPEMGLCDLKQQLYYYNFNCRSDGFWQESKILPYGMLKTMKPSGARYSRGTPIDDGGWHFSFLGNTEQIIQKVKSWAHNEYNQPDIIDPKHIEETVKEGKDIFKRDDQSFKIVELSHDLPQYIIENIEKYKELGFIK